MFHGPFHKFETFDVVAQVTVKWRLHLSSCPRAETRAREQEATARVHVAPSATEAPASRNFS